MNLDKIKDIVAETLCVDVDDIKPETSLFEDLGADSLDAVELNMALEDSFGIKIPDEDLAGLKTVADIVAYVDSKTK